MSSIADKPYRTLAVLVAVFLVMGVCYSIATPIFETPDESLHLAVIRHITQTRQLPTVSENGEGAFGQEGLQAPLYYMIGAASSFWVNTSDYARQTMAQPKANFGDAALPGKKNAFIHWPDQAFPYHGTTLAVRIARWLSALMGAGTVALTFTPVGPGDTGQIFNFNSQYHCIQDEWAIKLDGQFTPTQQTYLYNGGIGRTWPLTLPP